jgi:hypothetical protein
MFKNIIKNFKLNKEKKQIMKVIKLSYNILFSEKYDLSTEEGVRLFKKEIELMCKNRIEILQSYSIINPILYDLISIVEVDLIYFVNLNKEILNKRRNDEILSLEIEMEETKLEINLLIVDKHIKTGKEECSKNEYSYRGMIYRIEKVKKSPMSLSEKQEIKTISNDLDVIEEKIKNIKTE